MDEFKVIKIISIQSNKKRRRIFIIIIIIIIVIISTIKQHTNDISAASI
jgi:Sec-independent protein secretion pathway component TatC